uniref:Uncharacterized protein n=1 Tax=Aegilops tauschii subsp. strangulata TaxID=200361 RepID=A0A453ECN9_AEGTS
MPGFYLNQRCSSRNARILFGSAMLFKGCQDSIWISYALQGMPGFYLDQRCSLRNARILYGSAMLL